MPIIVSGGSPIVPGAPEPISIPHFAYPFQFNIHGAAANEQDSLDDIFACVHATVACPQGAWSDLPAFGIPSPLFAQAPLNTDQMTLAIFRWEPRAQLTATEYPDVFDAAVRNVQILVSPAQAD